MLKSIIALSIGLLLVGCSSDPKDADIKNQEIATEIGKSEALSGKETLGVNKEDEVVVQKKTKLTDHLRDVAYQVRKKQDELYGSRRFNTRGLFGRYEQCMATKKQKPKVARQMVLKDEELGQIEAEKFGYDEKGNLVAVEEKKLRDRIRDLEEKKNRLFAQEEELLAEINSCESDTN